MPDENTKEFRVKEYVSDFEKSLNYMAAVFFAIFLTAICCFCQGIEWQVLRGSLAKLYHEPRAVFYAIVAVLPTLPYYFCYTLKDDISWNANNEKGDVKGRDIEGLLKIFVFYEVGVMSIIYLLMQGNLSFSLSKASVSVINIVLLTLYGILVIKDYKRNKNFEYFYILAFFAWCLFGYLLYHSLANYRKYDGVQDWSVVGIMFLFVMNAGINTFFLIHCKTGEEMGILSNRIKIMIPILSVSTFTVSVFYCYWNTDISWVSMVIIALWITLYEIILSSIKTQSRKRKAVLCVVSFTVFVAGVPLFIWISNKLPFFRQLSNELPADLIIKWFILIGISIYMAAIKYWGYILRMYDSRYASKEAGTKMMVMVTWFRNSILVYWEACSS